MSFSKSWKVWIGIGIGVLAAIAVLWQGVGYYTGRSSFCGGSCHTMGEQFAAWQNSKHHASKSAKGTQAECIQCHFAPGGKKTLQAQFVGLRHLAAYMVDPRAHMPVRTKIPDEACLSCHDKVKLRDQPIKYADKVTFRHGPHFDKPIEGQKVFCDTCHVKDTKEKHFEVPSRTCFACHFTAKSEIRTSADKSAAGKIEPVAFAAAKPAPLNRGLGKCDTCHAIPTKPLQSQIKADDPERKPITHQTLIEAKVPCESCHLGVVQGTGAVETRGCFAGCHGKSADLLAKAGDGKLMHERHTAGRRAECGDCHTPVVHKKPADYLETARAECGSCHESAHGNQKILLAGLPVAKGVPTTPHLMNAVTTNCTGCHVGKKALRGHAVKAGSPQGCVACHTPKHEAMVEDWKKLIEKEANGLRDLERQAAERLAAVKKTGAAGAKLAAVEAAIAEGKRLMEIVAFGNGVHNRKYALAILDQAFGSFEDALKELGEGGK